jgi:alpha/beta superfamily hydrolase
LIGSFSIDDFPVDDFSVSCASERFATGRHGTVETMSRDTTTLVTIDGLHLEADVCTVPPEIDVRGAVVVAHPHPLYGGDRFNPVVSALFERLPMLGYHTLRFDFRGVNASEGSHDDGDGERLDVAAGVDFVSYLVDTERDHEIWVAGYSFGAAVGLSVIEPRVTGWIAVAPPLSAEARVLCATDPRPKLVVVPGHDQFCPPERLATIVADWRNTGVSVVATADHFLNGHSDDVARRVGNWLSGRVSG